MQYIYNMKVEIDTINKTIKVLDNSTWEDVMDMMVELPHYKEYTFIPNTIFVDKWLSAPNSAPIIYPYISPWKIEPSPYYDPYRVYCGSENATISSTNINQVK